MAEVYFAGMRASHGTSMLDKVADLFDKTGFTTFIGDDEFIALKVHFGERMNTAFLSPIYIREIVKKVKAAGGRPFLTDANTLYVGGRSNAVDHTVTAIRNGFGYATVEAPIIIADGLNGKEYVEVDVGLKHFEKVKIASAAYHADGMIAVSHFKGHEVTGFGGAIKNIGMGLGCRSGKQMMHADVHPTIDDEKCITCEKCTEWCASHALKLVGERIEIDYDKCVGCGECIVTCPQQAMAISWDSPVEKVQERIVEYAYGAVKDKKGKCAFLNFMINITPDCDCWPYSDAAFVADVGIAASLDPVALDTACADLVNKAQAIDNTALAEKSAPDKFRAIHPAVDWDAQLRYAEEVGLGSREYTLVDID
jgi:uncharacterized Fe-S center protein